MGCYAPSASAPSDNSHYYSRRVRRKPIVLIGEFRYFPCSLSNGHTICLFAKCHKLRAMMIAVIKNFYRNLFRNVYGVRPVRPDAE